MDPLITLTAVIAVSAIATAVASWLTWHVYRRLEHLQRAAVEVSAEMVNEARRNREAHFAPMLFPSRGPSGGGTGSDEKGRPGYRHYYTLTNHGPGTAFSIRVLRDSEQVHCLTGLAPNASATELLFYLGAGPDAPPLTLVIHYEDRFGRPFTSTMENAIFTHYLPPPDSSISP